MKSFKVHLRFCCAVMTAASNIRKAKLSVVTRGKPRAPAFRLSVGCISKSFSFCLLRQCRIPLEPQLDMPAGYAPLPTQKPTREADRELDEAFGFDESDDEHHSSETPIRPSPPTSKANTSVPAVYDFERDFDYARPPPGSPPRPSAIALPNDFGNSNGLVPSSPIAAPTNRPSFFRRAAGAILPTHYTRLPTEPHPRAIGGGTQNDGVFANVTAKPSKPVQMRTDDGDVYVVPEESQNTAPPVRPLILKATSLLILAPVLCCCAGRCSASLLGNHRARTGRSGHRFRNDHR